MLKSRLIRLFVLGILLCIASMLIFIFNMEISTPIWIPLFVLLFSCVIPFSMSLDSGYYILPKLQFIFFITPFTPLYGYVILTEFNWGWTPEMLAAINPITNLRLATVGAIGALGFVSGILITSQYNQFTVNHKVNLIRRRPFSQIAFTMGMFLSILLSYMSAPTTYIVSGAYGGESLNTIANYINFPGAYLVSYALIIVLYIDAESDSSITGKWKQKILIIGVAYIAIFLQFLRGDREILGLFFSLIALYLTYFHRLRYGRTLLYNKDYLKLMFYKRSRVVMFLGVCGLFFLLALGSLRFTIAEGNFGINDIFYANPWTMALLTVLAYINSKLGESLLWGKTYIEYLLSVPPGFITSALGVQRPIEMNNNLAVNLVETGISSGGAHIILPSLQNFGAIGVFLIMAIYSYLSSLVERNALSGYHFSQLLWLNLIAVVPLWFWYGEMSAIRAIMVAIFVYFISRLQLLKRVKN